MENNEAQARARIAAKIEAAYAPEDCEACEINGGTCWECAADALED